MGSRQDFRSVQLDWSEAGEGGKLNTEEVQGRKGSSSAKTLRAEREKPVQSCFVPSPQFLWPAGPVTSACSQRSQASLMKSGLTRPHLPTPACELSFSSDLRTSLLHTQWIWSLMTTWRTSPQTQHAPCGSLNEPVSIGSFPSVRRPCLD